MSMQSPRNIREWQQAVERQLKAGKNGTRMAVSHANDVAAVVDGNLNDFKGLTPTAPITVTYSTSTYIDQNRKRRGKVIADFPDVVLSTNAKPIVVENYEIAGQDQSLMPLEPFQSMGTSDVSSIVTGNLLPGSTWKFKVRALGGSTVKPGVWSSEQTVTIVNDTTPPPVPSAPTVTAVSGAVKVVWDGLAAGGGTMPGDFDRVEVAFGLASSPTTVIDTFYAASLTIIPKASYNVPHYVRLRAFDTTGNASAWSVQGVGIPVPLVDGDLILAHLDAATTEIVNIGAASILNGAINSSKLADNAVTQAKLQDQIISLAKLDTTVDAKITKGITDAATAQASANTANTAAGTAQTAADKAQAVVDAKIAAGATLNINGNFDAPITSPPLGWATGTNAVVQASSTTARSGANVMKATPSTASPAWRYTDYVASAKDRVFYAEYWIRPDQAIIAANNGQLLGTYFSGLDTAGAISTSPQYSNGALYPQVPLSALTPGTWTKFAVTYKVTQTDNVQMRFGPRIPNLITAGNTFEVDGFRVVDVTEAQGALDAAALAQAKADSAFTDAQTALTNAGLAQTSANGKARVFYPNTAPAGTGYNSGDIWFRGTDNKIFIWDTTGTPQWVAKPDTAIATAQTAANAAQTAANTADTKAVNAQTAADNAQTAATNAQTSANNAATAASTADGKAVTAQSAANSAATSATNAQTAANNASTLANSIVKTSTSAATGTPPSVGALWNQTNAAGDLIINTWTANAAGTAWVLRKLDDAVIGNLNAATINAGIISAARFNATDIRAKFIEAGKITAGDIVTGTLTSASGVFGTIDASIINAGTLNAARLLAGDIRAKFLTAGLVTAADIVTGTLTSASGVFGTIDASIINAGTLNAARLLAGDVRAKFLAAGLITAVDMVTGTITAASGIIGSLDIGKVTTGTMSGSFITANTINAKHLLISDLVNFAPSLAESVTDNATGSPDWTFGGGMSRITSSLDASGYRLSTTDNAGTATAFGPYMAVRPGDSLYGYAKIYRGAGATQNAYIRYYWYDSAKVAIGTPWTELSNGGPSQGGSGAVIDGTATVPAGAAYARYCVLAGSGTGGAGFYFMQGYKQTGTTLISDGAVTTNKVVANGITAKNILVGDFQNFALGSDFEDATAVPWTLDPLHTLSTTQKKSGTTSLRLAAGTGVKQSYLTADMRVKEGEQYYFKMHAYIDATYNGTSSGSKLRIGDQANVFLGAVPYNAITRSAWTTTPLEVTVTIPAGVTSLTVALQSDHTAGLAYIDDIQVRRVSEPSLIMNLGVEKLTASTALIDTGVIDKLWTDVVRSRKITTDMMIVGRGVNGIIDEYFELADTKTVRNTLAGAWGTWSVSGNGLNIYTQPSLPGTSQKSFYWDVANPAYDKTSYIPVEPGQKWRLSVMFTSTGAGPRATGRFIKRDGTTGYTSAYWTMRDGTANVFETSGSLKTMERIMTVPADVAYFMPAVQFDTAATSATVYGGATFTNMATSSLVVDGAISARNLTVTEEMWTNILHFKQLTGLEIDVNALGADTGWIGALRGYTLINDAVTTTVLKADAITSKHTLTGATIQTLATASRGIKLSGGNFTVWNSTGSVKTLEILGATGAVNGTGVWKTGSSGNYIEMTADAGGGLLRFWTGSGTGRGNIYARDDAGGKRMTITYSDLDAPTYTVPLIAVWDTKVNLSYGSMVIQVGKHPVTGVEELLLDADGSRVTMKGNVSLESGRLQTFYNWASGTPVVGGYVGQRPETAVTTNDFELRAATGSIRLSGTDLYAMPIWNNTTASAANVFIGSDGLVKRVSSASRYKADQQVMDLPDSLLDIPVKDWMDKAAHAQKKALENLGRPMDQLEQSRYDALLLHRFPGVIAEDVEASDPRFVVYGPDGRTESVLYERLAVAQIAVLKRQLDSAMEQISELRAAINA